MHCDVCNSTGEIEYKGHRYICPECDGEIKVIHTGYVFAIDHIGTIGKIEIEEYGKTDYYSEKDSRIAYMIDSTGVGTGTLWPEYLCFACKEDALEFCDNNKPVDDGGRAWIDSTGHTYLAENEYEYQQG